MPNVYGLGRLEADLNGVRVDNIRATIRELNLFAPELKKEMDREIAKITEPFVQRARGYAKQAGSSDGAPLSRWNDTPRLPGSRGSYAPNQGKSGGKRWEYDRLRWNTGAVTRGIRSGPGGFKFANNLNLGTSDKWTSLWSIRNSNAAGAVFELSGSGAASTPMVGNIRSRHGRSHRLIWRAWDELRGVTFVPREVEDVIAQYVDNFNRGLKVVKPARYSGKA